MVSHAWLNTPVTLSHNPAKKPFMPSQCLTIRTAAPTRAVIAMITKPIGLADNAALKAHWAAVITAILAATVLWATDMATIPAVAAMLRTRLTANRALLFNVARLNKAMALLPNTMASENSENATRDTTLAAFKPTKPTMAKAITLDNTGKFSVNPDNAVAALPTISAILTMTGDNKPPTATVILLICCIINGNAWPGPFKMALAMSSVTAVPPLTDSFMPSMFCLS